MHEVEVIMKYVLGEERKSNRRTVIIGALAAVFVLMIAFILWLTLVRAPAEKPKAASVALAAHQEKSEPEYTEVNGRYLMNGTIVTARAVEKWSKRADGSTDWARPYSALNTFQPELYDDWIADFECPSLDIVIPYQIQVDLLQFNCRPEFVTEAAKHFSVFNLANNHSGDKGRDGFEKTRAVLATNNIQAHGHYDPSVKEDICEVVGLQVRLKKPDGSEQKATMPIAFCAWHYFGRTPREGEIEHMTQYSKIMPVFAFVHMGQEYLTTATPIQVDIAHRVIDAGADFVIANNPHWVQNSEVYKGKLITYSTGNFIFDQIDAEGMRSVSIDVAMNMQYNQNIAKWLALGESCKKLHDECFAQALSQGLTRPDFKLSYSPVAGDNSGRLTKRGSAALQKAIEERTNWTATSKELGQ
ncbi:MAG TPA: CapA family protein [Candidatus Saccharimonadales bacterium]